MHTGLRKKRQFHDPEFFQPGISQALILALTLLGLVIVCVLLLDSGASH